MIFFCLNRTLWILFKLSMVQDNFVHEMSVEEIPTFDFVVDDLVCLPPISLNHRVDKTMGESTKTRKENIVNRANISSVTRTGGDAYLLVKHKF